MRKKSYSDDSSSPGSKRDRELMEESSSASSEQSLANQAPSQRSSFEEGQKHYRYFRIYLERVKEIDAKQRDDKNNRQLYLNKAEEYANAAIAHFNNLTADTKELDLKELAQAALQRGILYSKYKNDDIMAYKDFDAARQLDPSSAKPHKRMGIVLRQNGKFADAVTHFTTAIEKAAISKESTYACLVNRGICHFELGNTDQASRDATHASKLRPEKIAPRHNLQIIQNRLASASAEHGRK